MSMPRTEIRAWAPLLLLLLALAACTGVATAAAPPAGTPIGNAATADYIDADGVARSVTSNTVYTVVQQLVGVTLI